MLKHTYIVNHTFKVQNIFKSKKYMLKIYIYCVSRT